MSGHDGQRVLVPRDVAEPDRAVRVELHLRARCAAGGPFDWYEQGPVGFVVAGSVRLDASSSVAVTPPR